MTQRTADLHEPRSAQQKVENLLRVIRCQAIDEIPARCGCLCTKSGGGGRCFSSARSVVEAQLDAAREVRSESFVDGGLDAARSVAPGPPTPSAVREAIPAVMGPDHEPGQLFTV
jgi:hypothetical protein